MANQLSINIQIKGDNAFISLSGVINEDAEFTKMQNLNLRQYVFDFEKIQQINSCGIRDWIKFLQELGTVEIVYENCPQIIIEQINMVHGFITNNTKISTFYAPYFCDKCDSEKKIKLKSLDIKNGKAPINVCPECGDNLEFDALEKQYFHFLSQTK